MNAFYDYVVASGETLHKGAPYAFFLKHQKKYLTAVEKKKREMRRIAKDENSWEFPMHEINAAGTCPEDMDGLGKFLYWCLSDSAISQSKPLNCTLFLEPWDYEVGQNVTVVIENRKILLTKDVTIGHLGK